jgi:hypothetical protein
MTSFAIQLPLEQAAQIPKTQRQATVAVRINSP